MKNIFSIFLFSIFSIFFVHTSSSQVIQKKADKNQLIDGVKIESEMPNNKLIKIEATKISSASSLQNSDDIPKKKDKPVKPAKVLKYGNQKSSKVIKKEDEE